MALTGRFRRTPGRLVYDRKHLKVSYLPSKKGIAQVAVSVPVAAACRLLASTEALPYAVRISPRSNRIEPGHVHYQDSFTIDQVRVRGIGHPPMTRVGIRLANTSPQATIVEVGTERSPRYRVLGKTLDYLNRAGATLTDA